MLVVVGFASLPHRTNWLMQIYFVSQTKEIAHDVLWFHIITKKSVASWLLYVEKILINRFSLFSHKLFVYHDMHLNAPICFVFVHAPTHTNIKSALDFTIT
jgi:uncharacterized protein with PQ loop repeat